NDAIGRIDNSLRGSIVLLQFEHLNIRIMFLEIKDDLNIRSTKPIYTLRIIPYHTDIFIDCSKTLDNQVLGEVGILILIHHEVLELMLIFAKYFGMLVKQNIGFEKQIVKIHCASPLTTLC